MLFEYLKEHYDDGEPIFTEDIHIEGMRRNNFCQQLKTLTDNGKIKRYEKGNLTNYDHSAQFSIFRSGTLENSFTLFVTTVYPIDIA